MINLNKVVLVGRLTKDIELKKANNNSSVCNFTLAVDRVPKPQQPGVQTADFINCVAWGQPADFLANYARKGTIVSVDGRINTRNYDGQNGKVYVTEVRADAVQIISNRNNAGEYQASQTNSFNNNQTNQTFTPNVEPDFSDDYEDEFSSPSLSITDDDLPFY